MKKKKEFDNILDECLERLIKGETIEQCLASYPEQAAELEPLLQTVLVAQKASAVEPRPEFRERARYQFRAALQETEMKRGRRFFFGWQPQWATAVIAVLVLLLSGGGTVAAANNSMPDEPLYQVKLAIETVRLALTPSTLGKAELYVSLADKRVTEITKMAGKGKPEAVARAARQLNTQLIAMASLAAPREEDAGVPMAPAPREAPQAAIEEAPASPVEKEPRKEDTGVFKAPAPRAGPREAPAPPGRVRGGRDGGEDERIEVDKRAKLREIMARRAVEHPAALRAVLERAPESVKPALRRAIAVADSGYEEALKALD